MTTQHSDHEGERARGDSSALLIVSNRLPVTVKREADHSICVSVSSGGLVAGLREIHKQQPITWVGHGGNIGEGETDIEAELTRRRLADVPLPTVLYQRYYNGMSNETIWPLFHYFPSNIRFSYKDWKAYEEVNARFAERVLALARDHDRVWVHDYHLMLLPKLLREGNPTLKIAYFHHIPFPSSDIFRVLPARKAILEGLLGANLIGFHAFDYARHFLSSVVRVLGHDAVIDDIYLGDRIAKVGVFPLGVDFQNISRHLHELGRTQQHRVFAEAIGTPYIFLGVDRLDYTKGIPERMEAFREFLHCHPEYLGKVTLVQLCVPTRSDIKSYHDLKADVERLVGEINGQLGSPGYTPIHYLYKNLPLAEVVALYKASHVALVTPLRDGLNLVSKEYVASQDENEGVLILSEFAGASVEMGEALWVNPYDVRSMARQMYKAVTMAPEERRRRMALLRGRVAVDDNLAWSRRFMEAWQKSVALSQAAATHLVGACRQNIVAAIASGKRIFIFCDNDGTLTPIRDRPELAVPDEETLELLHRLAGMPRVRFTLVTGRPRSYCETYFGELPINIFAEHGSYFKAPRRSEWKSLSSSDDFEHVRAEILPVLNMFVHSVPGSEVEEKSNGLVWHYRNAEPQFAENQAHALMTSLQQLLQNTHYVAGSGKKLVEVRNRMTSKGHALEHFLAASQWQDDDSLVSIGDDTTDEDMYRIHPESNFSIHVGRPHFKAKHFLDSTGEVRVFFRELLAALEARPAEGRRLSQRLRHLGESREDSPEGGA